MIDEDRLYRMLGERLRTLREKQVGSRGRMTQAELALQVGLERTSITNIEKGAQKVPLHVLFRLCQVLRVPVAELLPTISEVHRRETEEPLEELPFGEFGEQVVKAPPLTTLAIKSILRDIETQ